MSGIIKERLFTPGPTPLLMEAQARAMVANVHHRTETFRRILRETLDLLKYYFNTQNDVLILASSGSGAMEGSVSNLVSPGERILGARRESSASAGWAWPQPTASRPLRSKLPTVVH